MVRINIISLIDAPEDIQRATQLNRALVLLARVPTNLLPYASDVLERYALPSRPSPDRASTRPPVVLRLHRPER